MRRLVPQVLLATLCLQLAHAHQQPMTRAVLDVGSDQVSMELHLPVTELELAFGHDVAQHPKQTISSWEPGLREYLIHHVHPLTLAGQPWSVQILDMTTGSSEQTQSGPFQEVIAHLLLQPPAGSGVRHFMLNYDAIMHQVVSHKTLLSVHGDWASGKVEPAQVGTIAMNTATSTIDPVSVDLGEGSWWEGFKGMVNLGAQHIRGGLDHLLFLIVLLLPATLVVRNHEWQGFGGVHYSMIRLFKIVSAFTLGHSLTLLLGALHWIALPQQPVEVLIAVSILVTAIHALRPIFPGREPQVAAAFGLVHGLAFATVLADLRLTAGPMALSILGFNLGIELTQLFVVALTIPWLILLSQTPVHKYVRCGGAVLAGVAAIGWIVNRVSGQTNVVERWTETLTKLAPLGVLLLAVIAIPAYFYNVIWTPAPVMDQKGSHS